MKAQQQQRQRQQNAAGRPRPARRRRSPPTLLRLVVAALVAAAGLAGAAAATGRGLSQLDDSGASPSPAPSGGLDGGVSTRVVGGLEASQARLSYQVGITQNYICGGSLIAPNVALTASHCQMRAGASVTAGVEGNGWMSGPTDWTVKAVRAVTHPYNVRAKFVYDVTLLFLESCPTALVPKAGNAISTIKIASQEELDEAANNTLVVSGWGTTSSGANQYGQGGQLASRLRYGLLNYLPGNCAAQVGVKDSDVTPDMLCAYGKPAMDGLGNKVPRQDSCQGDSGGPLIFNKEDAAGVVAGSKAADLLLGVVSWGIGCGQEDTPALYANLPLMKLWIDGNVDAVPRPASCPGAGNATATWVQVSDSAIWAGTPGASTKIPAAAANDTDSATGWCRNLCATKVKPGTGCVAFGVTAVTSATQKCDRSVPVRRCFFPVSYYCHQYRALVPPRLCAAGETLGLCARSQQLGSWRLKYEY